MRIYLVAQAWFRQLMKIYLAGTVESLHSDMKIYLAESGGLWEAYFNEKQFAHAYILQSFYYADEFTEKYIIPNAKDFMLDSGAFSFMQGADAVNWDEYIERYADFINRNHINHFFELDIDSVVGYDKVLEYRNKLERITGKQCIPVWHINRGKEEFIKSCDEYDYVALGGIAGVAKQAVIYKKYQQAFPWFISIAHKHGAKIHGLGYTNLNGLKKYHFDSVDSTAWTTGNRFGYIYKFNGHTMRKIGVPPGNRIADVKSVALINYTEWIKFQQYAETYL